MRILFAKSFGIGNSVMSVPAVKALATLGSVDVLVGSTSDDMGAIDVFSMLRDSRECIDQIFVDRAPLDVVYDVVVLSIPYDGRWKNGIHFSARKVVDGRTRPDPTTVGLVSWTKHETLYQMESAYELGYSGPVPDMSFFGCVKKRSDKIYLGLGFKRDTAGFWRMKHWGDQNYVKLIEMLGRKHDASFITTGNTLDFIETIRPIQSKLTDGNRLVFDASSLRRSFDVVASSIVYVGNDTGMMHVAASAGIPTIGIFMMENLIVKNHPRCERWHVFEQWKGAATVEEIAEKVKEFACSS